MEILQNNMRAQAARQAQLIANSRMGIVTSYDPVKYACIVQIMPEGAYPAEGETGLSGWLPVQTIWSGPGWGVYCPPSVGDQVFVSHVEGDPGSGQIIGRVYDASHLPLAVDSGEFWLVHASGAFIKFTNDGNVSINSDAKLLITVTSDCDLTVGGNVNAAVEGNVSATVSGNLSASVTGTTTVNSTGDATIHTDGNATITAADDINLSGANGSVSTSGGNMAITATGTMSFAAPIIVMQATQTIGLTAATQITNSAPEIELDGAVTQGIGPNGGAATMQGPLDVNTDVVIAGKSVGGHYHTQPSDSHGDAEEPTSTMVN
jgi:phage gp45-like